MNNNFQYDLFISYSSKDYDKVVLIFNDLAALGFKVFFAKKQLTIGKQFSEDIQDALKYSQHFLIYYSKNSHASAYVKEEWQSFWDHCYIKDKNHRIIYVLKESDFPDSDVPGFLSGFHRPSNKSEFIRKFCKATLHSCQERLEDMIKETKEKVVSLESELEKEKSKVIEARDFYRHHRFWQPIAENGEVHVFTCGRDVKPDLETTRGFGGRTNIDVWDYRAVFDIAHFFSSRYSNTKIIIEDPTSKLQGEDFNHHAIHLADRISVMHNKLENKDCIIIGSPDVSDFAEILLARIHDIEPYTEKGRVKKNGFVIIKEKKTTKSSFYWQKQNTEEEGVVQIIEEGKYKYYPNRSASDEKVGKMYGILIVANNPYNKRNQNNKIIILSGFSGIATNAIAKIITEEEWINEFFKLDNQYVNIDKDFEALIGVEYAIDRDFSIRDTRRIKKITFESLVEIKIS